MLFKNICYGRHILLLKQKRNSIYFSVTDSKPANKAPFFPPIALGLAFLKRKKDMIIQVAYCFDSHRIIRKYNELRKINVFPSTETSTMPLTIT